MEAPASRPQVTVHNISTGEAAEQVKMPSVFLSPIRSDLVHFVHTNVAKNSRQPYGVMSQHGAGARSAGHQNSAASWGTGRAVSRIPRVRGSGTQRASQGAVGNMCRGGHMFGATKVWRRWHRHVNKKMKRHAVASALAASALPGLVEARGHKIDQVREMPLVVSDSAESLKKTKEAMAFLKSVGAKDDLERVVKSKAKRAGKGKMRGRRFTQRKGPLVIYKEDNGIVNAMRNIPGVECCKVDRLNILTLAPGAHLGRFIIWTKGAFNELDRVFGTFSKPSELKKNYVLPRQCILTNSDLNRIINSDEVQSVLRPKKENNGKKKTYKIDFTASENREKLLQINPYANHIDSAAVVKMEDDE